VPTGPPAAARATTKRAQDGVATIALVPRGAPVIFRLAGLSGFYGPLREGRGGRPYNPILRPDDHNGGIRTPDLIAVTGLSNSLDDCPYRDEID
jgi:hypothetical protein